MTNLGGNGGADIKIEDNVDDGENFNYNDQLESPSGFDYNQDDDQSMEAL